MIGSLGLGRAQFRRLGLQYRHGLRDFWVRLRVPKTRHERGRCDEATSGQETNKKALAIHVSELLYERRAAFRNAHVIGRPASFDEMLQSCSSFHDVLLAKGATAATIKKFLN